MNKHRNARENISSFLGAWPVIGYALWTLPTLALAFAATNYYSLHTSNALEKISTASTIAATFGAFIVPLVFTVIQNGLKDAPDTTALFELFNRAGKAVVGAQGFIALAFSGLAISQMDHQQAKTILQIWHLAVLITTGLWTIWFLKFVADFNNRNSQLNLIQVFFERNPKSLLQSGRRKEYLLVQIVKELALLSVVLLRTDIQSKYTDTLKVIEHLASKARALPPLTASDREQIPFDQIVRALNGLHENILQLPPQKPVVHYRIYRAVIPSGFGWRNPGDDAMVQSAAIDLWRSLSQSANNKQEIAVTEFIEVWAGWLGRYAFKDDIGWNHAKAAFESDFRATFKMARTALADNNPTAAMWIVDLFQRLQSTAWIADKSLSHKTYPELAGLEKQSKLSRIALLLYWMGEGKRRTAYTARMLFDGTPHDNSGMIDGQYSGPLTQADLIEAILSINTIENLLERAQDIWEGSTISGRVYSGMRAFGDHDLVLLLALTSPEIAPTPRDYTNTFEAMSRQEREQTTYRLVRYREALATLDADKMARITKRLKTKTSPAKIETAKSTLQALIDQCGAISREDADAKAKEFDTTTEIVIAKCLQDAFTNQLRSAPLFGVDKISVSENQKLRPFNFRLNGISIYDLESEAAFKDRAEMLANRILESLRQSTAYIDPTIKTLPAVGNAAELWKQLHPALLAMGPNVNLHLTRPWAKWAYETLNNPEDADRPDDYQFNYREGKIERLFAGGKTQTFHNIYPRSNEASLTAIDHAKIKGLNMMNRGNGAWIEVEFVPRDDPRFGSLLVKMNLQIEAEDGWGVNIPITTAPAR